MVPAALEPRTEGGSQHEVVHRVKHGYLGSWDAWAMKDVTKKEAGEEGPFPGDHTILPPGLPSTSPRVLEAPASSSAHAEISWMRWCLQYSGEQRGGMWSFVTPSVLQFPADVQQQHRQGGMSLSLPLATVLAQHRSPTEPKEGCVSFLFKAHPCSTPDLKTNLLTAFFFYCCCCPLKRKSNTWAEKELNNALVLNPLARIIFWISM